MSVYVWQMMVDYSGLCEVTSYLRGTSGGPSWALGVMATTQKEAWHLPLRSLSLVAMPPPFFFQQCNEETARGKAVKL